MIVVAVYQLDPEDYHALDTAEALMLEGCESAGAKVALLAWVNRPNVHQAITDAETESNISTGQTT